MSVIENPLMSSSNNSSSLTRSGANSGSGTHSYVKNVISSMKDFDPTSVGLSKDFRLTKLTELKGCGCKVPREPLLKLMQHFSAKAHGDSGDEDDINKSACDNSACSAETQRSSRKNGAGDFWSSENKVGIGMDSCVVPLQNGTSFLIQTTDFFFPLIEDPYMMGRITAANVLSDLYAMGVIDCDNVLMLLGVSTRMTEDERDTVIPLIIRGFNECCQEAGTSVTGGQTVRNEWLLLGGVATSVCSSRSQFIMPDGAVLGDVLVLTKPLGIQLAVNAHQWMDQYPDKFERVRTILDEQRTKRAYFRAMESLSRLNRTAARLMHKYEAHGATDVTGFGLLGHAKNLARVQKNPVSFTITKLPIIADMAAVSKLLGTGLLQGTQAETSGGLLVILPRDNAIAFCKEIEKLENYPAWIIGVVEEGDRTAKIVENPRVLEVPFEDAATVV